MSSTRKPEDHLTYYVIFEYDEVEVMCRMCVNAARKGEIHDLYRSAGEVLSIERNDVISEITYCEICERAIKPPKPSPALPW